MNQLNSIILEGNVTSMPEATKDVYTFGVSQERFYKKSNGETVSETSVFDVVTYGTLAEIVAKNIQLGRGVRIVGRLKQEVFIEDGRKCSKVVVIAEHIEFKPMAKAAV